MSVETIYVVQAFKAGARGGLRAEPPTSARTEALAIRTAERLSVSKAGVVAFVTTGDPEMGDFDDDPRILFRFGRLPAQFEADA